jgi:hypothetical protein
VPDLQVDGREFYSLVVARPGEFALPVEADPYPCMIWAGEKTPEDFKADVARRIVGSGCRYAVCGGTEC